ncbi:hypothetical protein IMCC3135_15655 [Granulosicoccus antarcticus IMCC3135]|uniref:Uncharacterized protein n=1 Tax=Granulosicoccus antarcticus IMCC3135 TaxID=1192854 RepID=A0A2Z2NPL0_9GAMM|nr:hypothetical protein IMCC3135_15655 [Granulosicoccus antarcticus IMCC3135]
MDRPEMLGDRDALDAHHHKLKMRVLRRYRISYAAFMQLPESAK